MGRVWGKKNRKDELEKCDMKTMMLVAREKRKEYRYKEENGENKTSGR